MHRPTCIVVIAGVLLSASFSRPVAADTAAVAAAAYDNYSLSAPTLDSVTICHGFECKYRSELAFSAADRAALARLMAAGKASAVAERRAVAAAGAWYDRRIGPIAGTQGHVARAGYAYTFDSRGQFDCIDSSRNTTSLLLVLDQLKLLHHHRVAEPQARGYLIDGRPPHVTAVLTEKETGQKWAVDSWTRAYGQPPEIMPITRWLTLD